MNKIISEMKESGKVTPCLFYPIINQLNMSVTDILTDSAKQSQALLAIAATYPVSAVIRMTELWCEAQAFGMQCNMSGNGFPKLGEPLVEDVEDLEDIAIPQVENAVTAPLLEAIRITAPISDKPLIVGVTAPYTLSSVLSGSEEFMMNCITDPELVSDFLDRVTDFLIDYIAAYKSVGAAGIILAEPSVSMISPEMTAEFSNKYIKRIIDAAKAPDFAIIYHNCGAVNKHLDVLLQLEADAFHFCDDVDMAAVLAGVAADKLVMGNIDPRLLLSGKPEDIASLSKELVEKYAVFDNWLLSSGCDIAPRTPLENLDAMFTARS